jgi:type II secretory pathway component PulF
MPTFEFEATRQDGTHESGNVVGADLAAAIADLGKRGLQVERINVAKRLNDPIMEVPPVAAPAGPRPEVNAFEARYSGPSAPTSGRERDQVSGTLDAKRPAGPDVSPRSYVATHVVGPVVGRIPLANLGFMFRQFGTMLAAGVPIVQTLDTLAGQAKHPMQRQLTMEMRDLAREGLPVSSALQRYPESITPVMISMIRAGEEGGFLDSAAHQVADYIDRDIELRNLYKRATFYPKIVFAGSFLIILVTNVVLASLGNGARLTTPVSTAVWVVLALTGVGLWLFSRIGLANPGVKYWWDRYSLKVPVLGKTLHQLAMAKFGRAFGALYKAGVPVVKGMTLSADACGNEYLRAQMYPHIRRMEEGSGIFETLQGTGAFSQIVLDMISTGEKTGNMEQMVTKVSEYYEGEAVTRQNALATVSGVAIFLIVAVYFGVVLVQNYQQIYSEPLRQGVEETN